MSPMIELEESKRRTGKTAHLHWRGAGRRQNLSHAGRRAPAHQQGMDVVIGLIETHGRAETRRADRRPRNHSARKEVVYRAVTLREMDIDAILARKPHTCIVDELAHTNVPGCKESQTL